MALCPFKAHLHPDRMQKHFYEGKQIGFKGGDRVPVGGLSGLEHAVVSAQLDETAAGRELCWPEENIQKGTASLPLYTHTLP